MESGNQASDSFCFTYDPSKESNCFSEMWQELGGPPTEETAPSLPEKRPTDASVIDQPPVNESHLV